MKKPRLDAFDPNHTDKMADSFTNLPAILPPRVRPAEERAKPHHELHTQQPQPKAKRSPALPVAPAEVLDRKDTVCAIEPEYQRFKDLENDVRLNYGISPLSKSSIYRLGIHQLIDDYYKNGEQNILIRHLREKKA
jgi:hypothetical protein